MGKVKLKEFSTVITKGTTPTTVGGTFTEEGIIFVKSESIGESKFLDSSIFDHIDEKTDEKLKRSRLEEKDLLFSIEKISQRPSLAKIPLAKTHFSNLTNTSILSSIKANVTNPK